MNIGLVLFRKDLRLEDNPAFAEACNKHEYVLPLYILENDIVGSAQRWWLHHSLKSLAESLQSMGLQLVLHSGDVAEVLLKLTSELSIKHIYLNYRYEPLLAKRDQELKNLLLANNISTWASNGSLLSDPAAIKTKTGGHFKVYSFFWQECLRSISIPDAKRVKTSPKMLKVELKTLDELQLLPQRPDWASKFSNYWVPGEKAAKARLEKFIKTSLTRYKDGRDIPSLSATSNLSPYLHFGEISVWDIWRTIELVELEYGPSPSITTFLAELGWREFAYYSLYHYPELAEQNCRSEFDSFPWENDEVLLKRWQKGLTGYPIIDAGMRELWHTGYMHNRVRMIVASFLTKNLLIDWRFGAKWFLDTLLDADLASNSMNWQWVAGTGIDSAPYFRIFNPTLQSQKFDPAGKYIKKWVPELVRVNGKDIHAPKSTDVLLFSNLSGGQDYPAPIIDYKQSRAKALSYYHSIR